MKSIWANSYLGKHELGQ